MCPHLPASAKAIHPNANAMQWSSNRRGSASNSLYSIGPYQDSSGLTSVARRRLRGTWRCTPPLHPFSFGSNAIELAMSMPHTDGDSEPSDPLSLVWTAWEDPCCGSTWIHAVIASYHAYLIPGIQFRHPSHPSLTLLSQALLSLFNPLSLH
jgi:hypothetical protein